MKLNLIKFLYIILSIVAIINLYIFFKYDLSESHKDIIIFIQYFIAATVGCFMLLKPSFFVQDIENYKPSEYKFLGISLIIIGLSQMLFKVYKIFYVSGK